MSKIKVLHLFGKMDRGGAETLIMDVFREIDRDKFQFDFAVASSQKGDYDDEIKSLGGTIYNIPTPKTILDIARYKNELKSLISYNKYDVVHSHVHFFSGINAAIAKSVGVKNIISHSHSTNDGKKDSLWRKLYREYMRYLILKNSTYLLACGKEAGRHLFKDIHDKRVIQINNGVDIEKFLSLNKTKEEMLKELSIPQDSYVIGHIGRFSKPKNHLFLIDIFNEIVKKSENSYLILVGRGDLENKIKEKVKEFNIEDKVKFLGVREDIPELLNSFDVFLFPSLYEGLSVVLVEAQTMGIPCYVSDAITKENDMGNGNMKFLSLKENAVYWAESILNSNLSRNENGYKNVIKRGYSIDNIARKIEKIYASKCF